MQAGADSTDSIPPFPSDRGRYEQCGSPIAGGMSVVFKAFDNNLKRHVAIKRLRWEWRNDAEICRRFNREAQEQQRAARSDGVVRVVEIGTDKHGLYIVSEWMPGGSLAGYRDYRNHPLEWQEACRICSQVAAIMQSVHDLKIVHRDIKPGNILLAADASPRIGDFGIVRIATEPAGMLLTKTSEQLGTSGFQAPEQLINPSEVDCRADIWSLGATLHYLMTGTSVTIQGNEMEVVCDEERLGERRVPVAVREIICRAVAFRTKDRFQKMSDFSVALTNAVVNSRGGRSGSQCLSRFGLLTAMMGVIAACICVWWSFSFNQQSLPEITPQNEPSQASEPVMEPASANLPIAPSASLTISDNITLIRVEAGHFLMGLPPEMTGQLGPQPRVEITRGFYIGETEITQRQWKRVMQTEPWRDEPSSGTDPDAPATFISWQDAVDFCDRLSKLEGLRVRLPTEAEWEFASRAGTTTRWSFGDDESRPKLDSFAWFEESSNTENPQKVAQKQRNPSGLFDTYGNVEEWCSDWFVAGWSPGGQSVDPMGPVGSAGGSPLKVLRGGSWKSGALNCSSVFRSYASPGTRNAEIGLRIVVEHHAVHK